MLEKHYWHHLQWSHSLKFFPRSVMPVTSGTLKQDLDQLTDEQLQQVADFIAFLKFRDKRHRRVLDPARLASLSTKFAEEDRNLAEAGMDDYAAMLALISESQAHSRF